MVWRNDQVSAHTYNQLIELSNTQEEDLRNVIFDANVRVLEENYINKASINNYNRNKNLILYNSLSEEERDVFVRIHSELSDYQKSNKKDTTAILIDMMRNDRKSFFLMCLAISFNGNVTYVVYLKVLQKRFEAVNGISAYTTHKLLMEMFDIDFEEADEYFSSQIESIKMLQNIIREIELLEFEILNEKINTKPGFGLLILDEYTIRSPWYSIWMYYIAKKMKIPIVYCGDKVALTSMDCITKHHQHMTNFPIAKIFAEPNIYFLNSVNSEYEIKVKKFRDILVNYNDNVPLNSTLMQELYSIFPTKFSSERNLCIGKEGVYLAKYHKDLYNRAYEIITSPEIKHVYKCSYRNNGKDLGMINMEGKFLEFLPLINEFLYKYTPKRGVEEIVRLLSIEEEEITVQRIENGEDNKITLERKQLDELALVVQEKKWLRRYGSENMSQYPLRFLCETYASRQGLCFPSWLKVEMELDTNPDYPYKVLANEIYVGLLTLTTEDQLVFHSTLLSTLGVLSHITQNQLIIEQQSMPETELMRVANYLRGVQYDKICAVVDNIASFRAHYEEFQAQNRQIERPE